MKLIPRNHRLQADGRTGWRQSLCSRLLPMLVLVGCGTWLGNPNEDDEDDRLKNQPTAEVNLGFSSPESQTHDITDLQGNKIGTITLTVNRHSVTDIKAFRVGASTPDIVFEGPYVVDLLAGSVTPQPEPRKLLAGFYARSAFTGHVLKKDEVAEITEVDPLIGLTSIVKGQYQIGSTEGELALEISWNQELGVTNQLDNAVTSRIVADTANHMVVNMDYSKWFRIESAADLDNKDTIRDIILRGLKENTSFTVQQVGEDD